MDKKIIITIIIIIIVIIIVSIIDEAWRAKYILRILNF